MGFQQSSERRMSESKVLAKALAVLKKHIDEWENNNEVQKTLVFLVPTQWVHTYFLQLLTGGFLKMKTRHLGMNPVLHQMFLNNKHERANMHLHH